MSARKSPNLWSGCDHLLPLVATLVGMCIVISPRPLCVRLFAKLTGDRLLVLSFLCSSGRSRGSVVKAAHYGLCDRDPIPALSRRNR